MKLLEVHEVHDIHSYQMARSCLSWMDACFAVRMGDLFLTSGLRDKLVSGWAFACSTGRAASHTRQFGMPEGEQFV